MKHLVKVALVVILITCLVACKKTSFIESPDALLTTSEDTLHFDTVFTTTGSVSQSFKIFNLNDQKLRLSSVKLMGGNTSFFKINVDGTPGTDFSNIEIEPNDSIYVFATVSINPTTSTLPFIVQDSVRIEYNGNRTFVQLDAFGQNANFFRNRRVTKDTTWNNNLPYVILGSITVDSAKTLTIEKGTKVYFHADAPFIVNGTLKVNGQKEDSLRVRFQGDRLDQYYRDFPGSWPGIHFTGASINNNLSYAIIKNAYQGIVSQLPASNSNSKVTLNQCIIDNVYDVGVLGVASSISATNCLVSNCGNNIALVAGGNYNFNHCTVVTYANAYLQHKNPVLYVTNAATQATTNLLTAQFSNSIFYGEGGIVDNEIVVEKKTTASAFNVAFNNVLYKQKVDINVASFTSSIKNQPPNFDSINVSYRYFNFHLTSSSPAKDAGNSTVPIDLDGKVRPNTTANKPDIGCYEL